MTATAPAIEAEPAKRGLRLPSAYTILFILIVIVAFATWIIPAGRYDYNDDGTPIPGTYHPVEQNPARIVADSLLAPINGMYGIESPEDGSISPYNLGPLFGAIDVAMLRPSVRAAPITSSTCLACAGPSMSASASEISPRAAASPRKNPASSTIMMPMGAMAKSV